MTYRAQIDEKGKITFYKDSETGEVISAKEYERRMQMQAMMPHAATASPQLVQSPPMAMHAGYAPMVPTDGHVPNIPGSNMGMGMAPMQQNPGMTSMWGMGAMPPGAAPAHSGPSPLTQPGANMLQPQNSAVPGLPQAQHQGGLPDYPGGQPGMPPAATGHTSSLDPTQGRPPTAGAKMQGKSLRMEGIPHAHPQQLHKHHTKRSHGFLDATSVAILLPTLVLLALIIAAAHKKRLFPWQTIRTFNPPSGMLTPRDYERSFLCPPNLRRHGRMGKRNPNATWSEEDGVVIPFGFLARTHLPITIPMGRLPNKNMFIVAPSGSGKTTLMRAIIKSLLAKPCVIIALEAKANDPNLDEKKEGFKHSLLPEAQHAGFQTLYFNPLDAESVHWNPLDLDPISFASSIVQDINSLDAEEQHWAERDMGYIEGLAQVLKWGAVEVIEEDENGQASEFRELPCNPRGLMKLVNNRRNIVESLRKFKNNPDINSAELTELTQRLSSIIRTDNDWDKNIQGVRGRLRMFKNKGIMRVTEASNIDIASAMHTPTVLIFGAPASLGPDAESLAACFVYQLQQALHTRYGTKSVLPLFAFFDEYQTLNIDLAGRLSAIVRGANGGLTVILQNIAQIASGSGPAAESEIRTIFSNSAIRVCLHNADEQTALFFSEEIGKHAVIVPGIADHYQATGFGIFPTSWNRIHSQQVVARVDPDAIKRMEKHHALVFLAAASDPEFGETKPLMVDLRGIEEIARLHLLHNVNSRNNGGGQGQAQPGFAQVQSTADAINSAFDGHGPAAHAAGQNPQSAMQGEGQDPRSVGQTVGQMAQVVSTAAQQVIGQLLNKGTGEMSTPPGAQGPSRFANVSPDAAAMAQAGRLMSESGGLAGAGQGVSQGGPQAMPGFAGGGGAGADEFADLHGAARNATQASRAFPDAFDGTVQGMPAPESSPQAMPGFAGGMPSASPVPQEPVAAGPRSCPHCNKPAGKGKFCIECGQFIGAEVSADPTPTQMVPSGSAFANAVPHQQQQMQQPQMAVAQPSQQVVGPMGSRGYEAGRPQPRYGGLEVTSRDSVPSKKTGMLEGASAIAEAARGASPFGMQGPTEEERLLRGTGGMPGAGPMSSRVAEPEPQAQQPQQDSAQRRAAMTSFNPDVSRFGFGHQGPGGQQPGGDTPNNRIEF